MGSASDMMMSSSSSSLAKIGKASSTDESDNVWSSILSEVRSNASVKLPSGKSIVVLGDNESGKTTLVAKLQGIEDPKKGCGLEYAYVEIRDEYRDDSTQLGVWVLDGNPSHNHLLRFALTEKSFSNNLIMLTVSMASPWSIIDQLQFWAGILHDHIDSLNLSPDTIKEYREKCVRRWVDYVEPGDELDNIVSGKPASSNNPRNSKNLEEEPILPHNTLTRNTGLDIVVVVTKTDHISTLERENDYVDEHFDFIQFHVRQFCIQYGAALFYTSVKEDKNCDLLYKYLVHRIYGLPFRTPALIVEKDAVFIPAGWDNEKKMAILQENMTNIKPEDFYNEIIQKPVVTRKAVNREAEVEVEDEQSFLERQLTLLQQQAANPKDARLSPNLNISKGSTPGDKRSSLGLPSTLNTTPKKGDSTSSERVLANFFNSLLSKKTGGSPSAPNSLNDASRSDAAAELDSLISKKKLNSLNSSDC
ncbi:Cytoplasmic dynein 1 light intermediate chain 2 [Orchesella cincta]|uniref:Dynein light intermediate chain n=1 Tax=Orchesella cincta TaxID=48709 RepID=A0A1D2NJB1_ORCCI|nr:Cytoplasmic dynein 1 light intermediate chain 2 [Orchesella cincta]